MPYSEDARSGCGSLGRKEVNDPENSVSFQNPIASSISTERALLSGHV